MPHTCTRQIFTREIPFAGYDIKDIKDHVEAGKRPEFPVGSWMVKLNVNLQICNIRDVNLQEC